MKKIIIYILISFLIFIPKIKAEEVYIDSIEIEDKSINAIEKSKPEVNGFNINFDLEFREIDDYVKYKLVVKNETDKDYYVIEETNFTNSNYLSYKYYSEGTIKANSESVVYLVVTYDKEVSDTAFVEDTYSESNKATIEIVDDKGEKIKNPKTGDGSIVIVFLSIALAISCIILFVINKNKFNKTTFMFLALFLSSIPLLSSADELIKISFNAEVEIKRGGYHIIYDRQYDQVIDASLIKEFDIIDNTCYTINATIDNSSFILCEDKIMLKSKKIYYPGDKVDIPYMDIYYTDYNVNEMIETIKSQIDTENYDGPCVISDKNTLYCSILSEDIAIDEGNYSYFWVYDKQKASDHGYTCLDSDYNTMNFSNISYDQWEEWKYIYISIPSTFTMPEHDVYFLYDELS